LIKTRKCVAVKVIKAMRVNGESRALFRKFISTIKSPWITRLKDACNKFGVDVVEGDDLLSQGNRGRVFKAIWHEGETFTLKIVTKAALDVPIARRWP